MTGPADPMQDQQDAATKHAQRVFKNLGTLNAVMLGKARHVNHAEDADDPARVVVNRWMEKAKTDGRTCPHIGDSPQVVFGGGGVPGVGMCHQCVMPIIKMRNDDTKRLYGESNRECDACGAITDHGHEGILQALSVILIVQLCPECGAKSIGTQGD